MLPEELLILSFGMDASSVGSAIKELIIVDEAMEVMTLPERVTTDVITSMVVVGSAVAVFVSILTEVELDLCAVFVGVGESGGFSEVSVGFELEVKVAGVFDVLGVSVAVVIGASIVGAGCGEVVVRVAWPVPTRGGFGEPILWLESNCLAYIHLGCR